MSDWQTILAIDYDKRACEVYRANVPGAVVHHGNVADMLGALPYADVVLGGPPCQPYSSAGKQLGVDDARDCVPDFCAAIEAVRPRMFLMEQVSSFVTDPKFQLVFRRTFARLLAASYVVEMRVFDAVRFGVPQFRKRAWFWGIRSDLFYTNKVQHCWPTPSHVWPHHKAACMFGGDLMPAVTVEQAVPPSFLASHVHNAIPKVFEYRWSQECLRNHPPASPVSPAPTVLASWGAWGGLVKVVGDSRYLLAVRHFTPEECARLQSMPDDFVWPEKFAKTQKYRIIGNGWASGMAQHLSRAFKAADPASRTVIDLFCGGGCGAVGWHGRSWTYRSPANAFQA